MALPFSTCPYISGLTEDTRGEIWESGEKQLFHKGDLIVYHESAEVIYQTQDAVLRAVAGSVLFLPKDCMPQIKVLRQGSVICIGYQTSGCTNLSLISTSAPTRIRNLFLHFAALHAQSPSVTMDCAMMADLYSIFYELQRNTADGSRRALQEDMIRPSVAYLEKHLTDRGWNLKQVAALSGVSETYFRTLFTRQYGCTPLQYVLKKRISMAEKMLAETNKPISEIAEQCGFHSKAFFCSQFQKSVGFSPEAFRKNQKTLYKRSVL